MISLFQITPNEFEKISELIYRYFGIYLGEQKVKLVEGRLQKILSQRQFSSFDEYYHWLVSPDGDVNARMSELVDRISTNHTFFWREFVHFEFFETVILPQIEIDNKSTRKLRIWCAASSTGQEPYTLAMIIKRYFGVRIREWDIGVLATDISRNVLDKCLLGIYSKDDVEQLPKAFHVNFKIQGQVYQINEDLKQMVTFKRFNLINPFPFKGKFDAIFCRNVMIYFDAPTKVRLVENMFKQMNDGGHFVISLSESLDRVNAPFKFVQPGIYIKKANRF